MLLAALFKLLVPLILVVPGILAAQLVATDPAFAELVGGDSKRSYGALVNRVLPAPLVGFFAAVMVGSILSTFNSVLNSAATLFSLDVYKNYLNKNATTKQVVRSGQICSFLVAVFAVVAAPTFFHGRDGIFGFFQSLNGVYFIPLLAVVLVGIFNKTVNGRSATISLLVGLVLMAIGTFLSGKSEGLDGSEGSDGWVVNIFQSGYHYMGAVFALLIVLQLVLGSTGFSRDTPYVQEDAKAVDLTPWKPAPYAGAALIATALAIYAFFAR